MAEEKKICLVKFYFESGNVTRPMDEFIIDGKTGLYEYDVLKIFKDENEAKEYARKNTITLDL